MDWCEPVAQILGAVSGIGVAVAAVLSWNTAKELHRIEAGCDAKQARTVERYQAELGAVRCSLS